MEVLIGVLLAILLGGIGTYYLTHRLLSSSFQSQIALYSKQIEELKLELQNHQNHLQQTEDHKNSLNLQYVKLQAEHTTLQDQLKGKQLELIELNQTLKEEFKNLANDIFDKKSNQFKEVNKEAMDSLLLPFATSMREFKSQIVQINNTNLHQHGQLKQQIEQLATLNTRIGQEAENLTKALKGDTKMQGNWGEMILVKLLENTSLQKGVNYFEQESFDVDGQRKQLDVRIALPNNKNIIIDSKVSIVAYQSFVNESEGPTKDKFLKDHLNSIRAHIKNLSSKNYPDIPLETLDFTILFMPVESAYISAVQADSHLFNEAFSQHIVLASPSTLLAMLKTIDHVWQREKQNQNVLEIAKRAGNLHDKFAALLDDFTTLERNFSTTQNTLGHIKTKLKGQGNLINQVQTIRQLGVQTKKIIDPLIWQSQDEND